MARGIHFVKPLSQTSINIVTYIVCALLVSASASEEPCNLNTPNRTSCPCKNKTDAIISEEECTIYRTPGTTDRDLVAFPIGCEPRKHQEFVPATSLLVGITIDVFTSPNLSEIGINATILINDKRIKGFTLKLENHGHNKTNICRYYDFRKAGSSLVGAKFFSDDLILKESNSGGFTYLDVAVFYESESVTWSRFLMTPVSRGNIGATLQSVCNWNSFIVIDTTANNDDSFNVMFTQAPDRFNVDSYSVQVLSIDDNGDDPLTVIWGTIVAAVANTSVGQMTIPNLSTCTFLKVRVKCSNDCCTESTTFMFHPVCQGEGILVTVYATVGILAIISAVLTVFFCVRRARKKPVYLQSPQLKIFIVYSYDIQSHCDVVERFAQFLESCCNCSVFLDKWHLKNEDPKTWVNKCIENCDYVIIIWSRGALLKVQLDNKKVLKNQPGYLADFGYAIGAINTKLKECLQARFYHHNVNKFVNVSFPYDHSRATKFPITYAMLPHFRLPSNFDQLLCHLHCTTTNSFDLFSLTGMRRHNCCFRWWLGPRAHPSIGRSLAATPEGSSLSAAINGMSCLGNWFDDLLVDPPEELREFVRASSVNRFSTSSESGGSGRISGCGTGEIDLEEDGDDDRYSSASRLNEFPPDINEMPIFGPTASSAQFPHWPAPRDPMSQNPTAEDRDDAFTGLPPEVFQFGTNAEHH